MSFLGDKGKPHRSLQLTTQISGVSLSCTLLVRHFQLCLEGGNCGLPKGFYSRVFEKILHPEKVFVGYGQSEAVLAGEPSYPEHLVPCAFMYKECCRLIEEEKGTDFIAPLLAKR